MDGTNYATLSCNFIIVIRLSFPQLHHVPAWLYRYHTTLSLSPVYSFPIIIIINLRVSYHLDVIDNHDLQQWTALNSFDKSFFPKTLCFLENNNLFQNIFLQNDSIPYPRLVCYKSPKANGPFHLPDSKSISQSLPNSNW